MVTQEEYDNLIEQRVRETYHMDDLTNGKPWDYTQEEIEQRELLYQKHRSGEKLTESEMDLLFMDKQCVPLVDSLNRIDGICTISSCCGHGDVAFGIQFISESLPGVFDVARWFKAGFSEDRGDISMDWQIELCTYGIMVDPLGVPVYRLRGPKGERAYWESIEIAQRITEWSEGKREKPQYMIEYYREKKKEENATG